jgi:thioredoxin reductase (NADPH)
MPPRELADCLVIGAGPAGMTAGLYLRRFHRAVAVVGGNDSRAALIPVSHNYPGFPEGIPGTKLLERLRRQLAEVDGAVTDGRVETLVRADDGFAAGVGNAVVHARTVVMATGLLDREPRVPGIADLRKRGLLRQCPICDGYEFTGRRIAVIGAGDHGAREALFLRNYSEQVTFIAVDDAHLPPESAAADLRARAIDVVCGEVISATPDGGAVRIELAGGVSCTFDVLYAALGATPRAELATALGAKTDDVGALVVDAHCRTTVDGLYAAGDVVHGLDQLAVSVGQAAIAATAIHNELRARGL